MRIPLIEARTLREEKAWNCTDYYAEDRSRYGPNLIEVVHVLGCAPEHQPHQGEEPQRNQTSRPTDSPIHAAPLTIDDRTARAPIMARQRPTA